MWKVKLDKVRRKYQLLHVRTTPKYKNFPYPWFIQHTNKATFHNHDSYNAQASHQFLKYMYYHQIKRTSTARFSHIQSHPPHSSHPISHPLMTTYLPSHPSPHLISLPLFFPTKQIAMPSFHQLHYSCIHDKKLAQWWRMEVKEKKTATNADTPDVEEIKKNRARFFCCQCGKRRREDSCIPENEVRWEGRKWIRCLRLFLFLFVGFPLVMF